jgi:phosphoenolpyruvate phosphomutase
VTLKGFRPEREDAVHGEWMGIVKLSPAGTKLVREKLKALAAEPARLATMKLPDLLQLLVADGAKVRVIYTTGHWLDVDSVEDVVVGAAF